MMGIHAQLLGVKRDDLDLDDFGDESLAGPFLCGANKAYATDKMVKTI